MNSAQLAKLALEHVSRVLDKLTDEQLEALASGRGWFEFRTEEVVVKSPKTKKVAAAPSWDVQTVVDEIRALGSSAEITSYLNAKKYTVADLKAIAAACGPTVTARGTKPQLVQNIAEGVAGFRERAAAIGGWGR